MSKKKDKKAKARKGASKKSKTVKVAKHSGIMAVRSRGKHGMATKKAGKRMTKDVLKDHLRVFFTSNAGTTFSFKQIFKHLHLNTHPLKMLAIDCMEEMAIDGYLQRISDSAYCMDPAKIKIDYDNVMHAILEQYDLPYHYPESVEKAAEEISDVISQEEISRREDFRDVWTCTIDPHDAKDFDDALSIRKIESSSNGGCYEVGVHIADVSHYVTEGSIIDREAQRRATSVYLVDRTIPMLPERLCNYICSLRPDEEKLAYSAIFTLDEEAEVKDYRIVHTVIKSNRRYAYEEVQAVIDKDKRRLANIKATPEDALVDDPYTEQLLTLDRLAKKLREHRFKNGSVRFEREEMRFEVDENGKPIRCYFKRSLDANKLVEEFMLLANKTVAEHIGKAKNKKVLPYRIHESPDVEKLETLRKFITKFGYKLKSTSTNGAIAKALNTLMDEVEGKPEGNTIQMVALRAMMKAKYSVHNVGHFGLAFDYYTHFTSPIRRYPDTMVHRLLTYYDLPANEKAQNRIQTSEEYYEEQCEHSSDMEQTAAQAERDSIKYKMVEFMSQYLGQEFDAHISGLTEWGVFCEIDENHCEGMISLQDMDDDWYDFDEKNFCLIGRRHHRTINLGDPIKIRVAKANLEKRQLDFIPSK